MMSKHIVKEQCQRKLPLALDLITAAYINISHGQSVAPACIPMHIRGDGNRFRKFAIDRSEK